jgi:hypothetical protein
VNLQWGQAHLLVLTLSMGALVAFRRAHLPLGGLLLGAATLIKLFPALLIVYLLLRRRWHEVAWSVAACAGLTLLALAVVGAAPFAAFFHYQLPRIANGEAFAFFRHEWFYVSRNLGVSGLVFKLGFLGVPNMSGALSSAVGWAYTALLLALVALAARAGDLAPLDEAQLWLGLLCLGSLRSPLAPGIYVAVGAQWLVTLLLARARQRREVAFLVFAFLLMPGLPRLPAKLDVAVALLGQAILLAIALRAVVFRASR